MAGPPPTGFHSELSSTHLHLPSVSPTSTNGTSGSREWVQSRPQHLLQPLSRQGGSTCADVKDWPPTQQTHPPMFTLMDCGGWRGRGDPGYLPLIFPHPRHPFRGSPAFPPPLHSNMFPPLGQVCAPLLPGNKPQFGGLMLMPEGLQGETRKNRVRNMP